MEHFKRKRKKETKLFYLQENMELISEFDYKIFEFMFRSQKNDISWEVNKWFKDLWVPAWF